MAYGNLLNALGFVLPPVAPLYSEVTVYEGGGT